MAKIVTVEIKFFARCASIALAGLTSNAASMPELRQDFAQQLSTEAYQVLCGDGVRVAINQAFLNDGWQESVETIPAGAEVAFLPPVTGAKLSITKIKIQTEDFDFGTLFPN